MNHTKDYEHSIFVDSIFKTIDTLPNEAKVNAIKNLDSLFHALPSPTPFELYSKDSILADIYSYVKHDNFKALGYVDSMILLVKNQQEEEGFRERYIRGLYYKGGYLVKIKKYDLALAFYKQAKEMELKYVKNPCAFTDCSGYLGNLLFQQGKFLEAAKNYILNCKLHQYCWQGDYKGMMELQSFMANAGLSYRWAGQFDSADLYYRKALGFISENELKYPDHYYSTTNAKGVLYCHQADILIERGQYKEAEALYRKSIGCTHSADPLYTQLTQLNLSQALLKNGRINEANQLLGQLEISFDTLHNESALIKWYQNKSNYYEEAGQPKSALLFLKKYMQLSDSLRNRDKNFFETNITKYFEDIQEQSRLSTLNRENQVKTIYLRISLFFVIIAIIIILLFWLLLKRTRRLNLEIQKRNKDLQNTFSSLDQSQKENTRLMKIVAHDLKNPISAMNNLLYILLSKNLDPSREEILEAMQVACSQSLALIGEVLGSETEEVDLFKEKVDLRDLLENCVRLLQANASEKQQLLNLQAEPAFLVANSQKIWRIFSNVIMNAIKFSPSQTTIQIALRSEANKILFIVEDKGMGIPVEIQDHILDQSGDYIRLGANGETSFGLGLSITKKIIESYNGRIWFESNKGEGSVFYVEFIRTP